MDDKGEKRPEETPSSGGTNEEEPEQKRTVKASRSRCRDGKRKKRPEETPICGGTNEEPEQKKAKTKASRGKGSSEDGKGEKRPEEPEEKRTVKASRSRGRAGKCEKRPEEAPISGGTNEEPAEEPERKRAEAEASRGRGSIGKRTKVDDKAEVKDVVKDSKKDEVDAERHAANENWFKVVAPLHLGLNLKKGHIYSDAELRQKCGGDSSKLQSLEKFMEQPSKLVPADAPQASNAPPSQAHEDAPQKADTYVLGQVVWHRRPDGDSVLAKVSKIDDGPEMKYRLKLLSEDSDCTDEQFESSHSTLTPFDIMHVKNLMLPQGTIIASLPNVREAQPFRIGQVVWWFGPKRPSWPAKILELPASSKDHCKVRLFDPNLVQSGSTGQSEILAKPISVLRSELLRMERNDLLAFRQVMQVVEDAFADQDASATTA